MQFLTWNKKPKFFKYLIICNTEKYQKQYKKYKKKHKLYFGNLRENVFLTQ